MLFTSTAALLTLLTSTALAQAPLLPPTGQIYIGSWYQRVEGDTPLNINNRLNGIPGAGLSFFQTDIDISLGKDPRTTLNITDGYLAQLEETGTDALAYLTVYPFLGYEGVTEDQLNELGDRIKRIIERGRKVFLRLWPEMNGSWFNFGQDPVGFIASWRRAYTLINARIGTNNRQNLAYVWAPNSGNGYPYRGGISSPTGPSDARFSVLDTNGDGVFDGEDNAYTPYYPGDEWVDWVGLSIYHYGSQWPWLQNVVPESNKFEGLMQGRFNPAWGNFPFYDEFSGTLNRTGVTAGNKPFILAEGGSTFHYGLNAIGLGKNFTTPDVTTVSRVAIKKGFWDQFLNRDFLSRYPNFRAVCTFEFMKSEEDTLRDFTNFGAPPTNRSEAEIGADDVGRAFVEDAKGMGFVKWGERMALTTTSVGSATTGTLVTGTVKVETRTSGNVGRGESWGVVLAVVVSVVGALLVF